MHTRLRGQNNLLILHQLKIEPDFPCLAGEIVEPRPDMNIKVKPPFQRAKSSIIDFYNL